MEYGTAKVDELEKNGSSIVENDSFSRGERFSAIRGSVRRGPPAAPAAGFSPYRTKLLHFFGSGVSLDSYIIIKGPVRFLRTFLPSRHGVCIV